MSRVSIAIILVAFIAFVAYVPFSPGFRQERNMRLAEQHLPRVQAVIEKDPRFMYVALGVYTGSGGSLRVGGDVRSDHELEALEQLIESTSPPTPVVMAVRVLTDDEWHARHPEATTRPAPVSAATKQATP